MQQIYLVPHTHYDVAWALTKEDYLDLNEGILKKAIELMKQSDEYKFSWEQIFPLKMIEKRNPKLWSEIKEMIQKGRFEIVDGQYLMPDTMLPTGEVLIREIFFGKRYCKEKFGVDVPVSWVADSFGMNAQLPQIYKKAGYKWTAFRRGTKKTRSEFIWRGLDGTTILSHWMPLGYRAGLDLHPKQLEKSYVELNKYASTFHILMPSGSGVTLPQEETVEAARKWNKDHKGGSQMKIATPSEFFQAVEKEGRGFEVIEGELYDTELSEVFPQVCSSRMWVVIGARKAEGLLATAEQFATLAWLLGKKYPTTELNECWEKLLFVAFHDIITGCGIDDIYDEVREIFSFLESQLCSIVTESLRFIASRIDTRGEAVVVFNPLPRRVTNWCEVELELGEGWKKEPGLEDKEEIESQVIEVVRDSQGNIEQAKLGFMVDLPPFGYKVYRLVERKRTPQSELKFEENEVENPFFRVKADPETGIIEVFDKEGKLLVKGNELNIDNEIGDLYYHRYMFKELIKNESGEGLRYGTFKPKSFKIEKGPLKSRITFDSEYYCLRWPYRMLDKLKPSLYRYKAMDISKEVIIYRDLPRIEFVTKIYNEYPHIRLRVKFDTMKERMVYFRETQFGVVPEPTEQFAATGEKREIPAGIPNFLSWFSHGDGTRGITFMNKGIPAAEIKEGLVYLTLLRSVAVLSADGEAGPLVPTPDALELRDYTFEYALQHHDGDWKEAKSYKHSQEYHHRPLPTQANASGNLPSELSFLHISPDNLILSALKKAEDSDEVILRLFETAGEATKAEIKFFQGIKRATSANLLEEEEQELAVEGNKLTLEVKSFEIVTLKLRF
ncbi:Mannosylglycerate hydrolase [subsurface metagenome]